MTSNRNILLIDDDDNDANLIERALLKDEKRVGFHRVRDGEQGIAYLSGIHNFKDRAKYPIPDLVVLDLKMPRKNGFDVLKWMRGCEATRYLPVIVFTSSQQMCDINKAYELGANAFMVKPNSFEHFIEVMKMMYTFWIRHRLMPDFSLPDKTREKSKGLSENGVMS